MRRTKKAYIGCSGCDRTLGIAVYTDKILNTNCMFFCPLCANVRNIKVKEKRVMIGCYDERTKSPGTESRIRIINAT